MRNNIIENNQDSRLKTTKQNRSLHENEAKESIHNSAKKEIAYINDDDFGIVEMYYSPENKCIEADDMLIVNTPKNYDIDIVMYAWNVYKVNYCDYGYLQVEYSQIPKLPLYLGED